MADGQVDRRYFNAVGGRLTPQDVGLFFALRSESGTPVTPDDADLEIYLSPETAKALSVLLQQVIQAFESAVGQPIPLGFDPERAKQAITATGGEFGHMTVKGIISERGSTN